MHRFTESTPTSLAGADLVEVFVAGWEIECCVRPPVVGEPRSWTLGFYPAADEFPSPELDQDRTWVVTRGQGRAQQPPLTRLTDGRITAFWSQANQAPPAPGTMSLRGHLSGTAHGTAPDNFPTTTGIVHRIRLVTQHYTRTDEGGWLPVAGTITLCDLQRSPRWFTEHPKAPPTGGTPWVIQTGVLLDLAVRSEPAHSAGSAG